MNLYKLIGYDTESGIYTNPDTNIIENLPSANIVLSNTDIDGYENISSAQSWHKLGYSNGKDYMYVRTILQGILTATAGPTLSNWNSLSAEDKALYCKYILVPYSYRVASGIQTEDQDKNFWRELAIKTNGKPVYSLEGRARIYQEMRIRVADYVRTEQWGDGGLTLTYGPFAAFMNGLFMAQAFYKDCFPYVDWYVDTSAPDFKWWLNNTIGSPYAITGFSSKLYYIPQLLTDLNDIYNGNY